MTQSDSRHGGKWAFPTGVGTRGGWSESAYLHDVLAPLVERLRIYDALRLQLERRGGRLDDLRRMTEILSARISVKGSYRRHIVALTNPSDVSTMLSDVGRGDVKLTVRQLESGLPVYYLCRIRRDYWSEYSLVVEDIYRSPGYPTTDDRFVQMMDLGHETYYLRLSPFREGVASLIGAEDASDRKVDEQLYDLGRYVLQAAWHEDQRPGVLAAGAFGLRRFRQAIELLYLCLSGDLCELRSAVDATMVRFFEEVYEQPAIGSLLEILVQLEGAALNDLPQAALQHYARLARAFSLFLATEVAWGREGMRVPIYKLLFGNFSRLELVGSVLATDEGVRSAAGRLEAEAERVIDRITEVGAQA